MLTIPFSVIESQYDETSGESRVSPSVSAARSQLFSVLCFNEISFLSISLHSFFFVSSNLVNEISEPSSLFCLFWNMHIRFTIVIASIQKQTGILSSCQSELSFARCYLPNPFSSPLFGRHRPCLSLFHGFPSLSLSLSLVSFFYLASVGEMKFLSENNILEKFAKLPSKILGWKYAQGCHSRQPCPG